MSTRKSSKLFGVKQTMRNFLKTLFIGAAMFGIFSALVVLLAPEKISTMTDSLTALGNRGYKLPDPQAAPSVPDADVKILKTFSKVFVNIGKATKPALVYIQTKTKVEAAGRRSPFPFPDDFFFPFQPPGGGRGGGVQQGAGSGFIVDLKQGYVITNNHVVENADEITVQTDDDRKFKGKRVGADKYTDVAVVKLENFTPGSLKQVSFADSDQAEVGDWVIALGAPFELPQTLTVGVISATGRMDVLGQNQLQDFIQTDAAINPGNSGGPLLNIEGRVIGINTAILSRTGAYAGIGFAVPSNMAKTVAEMLINDGKVTRGFLGINMQDFKELNAESLKELHVTPDTHGVLVSNVFPGGPADKAGLKPYDIVRSVNGQPVHSGAQLRNKIGFTKPGTDIKLGVLRDGKSVELTARVGTYSEDQGRAGRGTPRGEDSGAAPLAAEFGMSLATLSPELRKQLNVESKHGVVITGIESDSIADEAMLARGDVIVEINRKAVKSVKDVENALKQAKDKGRDLLFLIERDGRPQIFNFRLR